MQRLLLRMLEAAAGLLLMTAFLADPTLFFEHGVYGVVIWIVVVTVGGAFFAHSVTRGRKKRPSDSE
ncbi:MAG: hypothetical protein HQ582_10550 [Planctomycetes bacterium]|nr:hypothetical protein [Planctomycetota bacterium]